MEFHRRRGSRRGRGGGAAAGAVHAFYGNSTRNHFSSEWVRAMVEAINQQDGQAFSRLIKEQELCIPNAEIQAMPELYGHTWTGMYVFVLKNLLNSTKFYVCVTSSSRTDQKAYVALLDVEKNVMSGICHSQLREGGLLAQRGGESSYRRLLLEFLRLRQLQARRPVRWNEVVKQCILLLDLYIDVYVDPSLERCAWLVPGLAVLCNSMNRAAYAADACQEEAADFVDDEDTVDDEETQNKYTKEVLNAIRPKLGKVRGDQERHGAYIVLLGQSIKRCLMLGNMQMAAGFLKLCDSRHINFSRVPRGPIVNFRYYLGKLYMQQEQFEQSESELLWAFANCPSSNVRVRRNILECLVPVRLRMGKLPPLSLLRNHRMEHYIKIISALKTGDVSRFDRTMEEYQKTFIDHGTILCVERMKFIVYRTLMRRVKEWWANSGHATKNNIVPIAAFSAALKWQSDTLFDDDEMACISANLIRMGYVKGYISWEHMVIVFSNQNPFPPLKSIKT